MKSGVHDVLQGHVFLNRHVRILSGGHAGGVPLQCFIRYLIFYFFMPRANISNATSSVCFK